MRMLSIDGTSARSAVCAWGVLCGVRVSSQIPERSDHYFLGWPVASAAKTKQHTEQPRQHAAVVDKGHGGVMDVASAPCQPSAARLRRP